MKVYNLMRELGECLSDNKLDWLSLATVTTRHPPYQSAFTTVNLPIRLDE